MKIICLGNPPYNAARSTSVNTSTKNIFQTFITTIIDSLNPEYFSLIVPSKWMITGRGLDGFRQRMLADKHLAAVTHFPRGDMVFPNTLIAGGVSYFLWKNNHDGMCTFRVGTDSITKYLDEFDTVIFEPRGYPILRKVLQKWTGRYLNKVVRNTNYYGIQTNFSNWKDEGIPCLARGRKIHFITPEDIKKHAEEGWAVYIRKNDNPTVMLDQWKVMYPTSGTRTPKTPTTESCEGGLEQWKVMYPCRGILETAGTEQCKRSMSQSFSYSDLQRKLIKAFILPPGTVCTDTYILMNFFPTEQEALNFQTYVHTKFFRYMLGLCAITQHCTRERFRFVPDLPTKDHPWTDEELYDYFDLTADERRYIDGRIV